MSRHLPSRGSNGGPLPSRRPDQDVAVRRNPATWGTKIFLGAALVFHGVGFSARAELEWKERRLVLEPPAGAAEVSGVFEFVNRGKNPVSIASVRADCGCTAMASENDVVLPGAKGVVRAVFHVGARKGTQTVSVSVTTNEPDVRQYDLVLDVTIKDFVTVVPGVVFWKLGDEPAPKILQVTLASGFRLLTAACTTAEFSVQMTEIEGGAVQLRIVPRDTWAKRSGTIKITVAQGGSSPVEVLAYARVL